MKYYKECEQLANKANYKIIINKELDSKHSYYFLLNENEFNNIDDYWNKVYEEYDLFEMEMYQNLIYNPKQFKSDKFNVFSSYEELYKYLNKISK